MQPQSGDLKRTPLHAQHVALGARMVGFAGYDMPIQFPDGVMAEHNWTREHCGLFDVSHMGPCFLTLTSGVSSDPGAHAEIASLVERLVPSDIASLEPGQARLTVLLNDRGGILDDLIITRPASPDENGRLYIVVNGAMKEQDWAIFERELGGKAILERADHNILAALQGPEAEAVLSAHIPECAALSFMSSTPVRFRDMDVIVSRCGYTGEDGFELLLPSEGGLAFIEELLADDRVKPIGLGARDSLRLEAGLCLYGHDLSPEVSPIEAGLAWTIQKSRRARANFPGAERILAEIENKPARKRVGIRPLGRAPAREGAEIQTPDGVTVGSITSGGFGPTLNAPVAMGYVDAAHTKIGTPLLLIVRGKPIEAEVTAMPFVPHKYKR